MSDAAPPPRTELHGRLLAILIACVTVALTAVPYLAARSLEGSRPEFGHFLGFTHNIDDNMVYASWIRQYADGSAFQNVLFSSEPQDGRVFHLLYFAMGKVSRITGLEPSTVILLTRLFCGMVLLHFLWWLLTKFTASWRQRFGAWLLLCFSSGLGWIVLFNPQWRLTPVDLTLPDATTFVSIYFGPLQSAPLALMATALGCMLLAEREGQSEGGSRSWWWTLAAGGCGLLLGNLHTYDVIPMCLAWGVYVLLQASLQRRLSTATLTRSFVFFGMTAITTAYTGWMLISDPVYGHRASVGLPSPALIDFALAYAPLIVLAVIGVKTSLSAQNSGEETRARSDFVLLLAVWAVINLLTPFLPVTFQRKLLLGAHIPLAILAGFALAALFARAAGARFACALAGITALLSLSNIAYLVRDIDAISVNRTTYTNPIRPFIYDGERRALQWLSTHAERGAVIQPLPWVACFPDRFFPGDATLALIAPALTGHQVHVGHVGETPDYTERLRLWGMFQHPACNDEERRELLRATRVRYLVTSQKNKPDPLPPGAFAPTLFDHPPSWLKHIPEASNADADVWRVEVNGE